MCEKKQRKITKGSEVARLREARRQQRIQRMAPAPTVREEARHPRLPQIALPIDKALQNRIILELAWKTVILMHKNKLIQEKIVALQRETSEFVANIMNHSENRNRYVGHFRTQPPPPPTAHDLSFENKENNNIIFKQEPNA